MRAGKHREDNLDIKRKVNPLSMTYRLVVTCAVALLNLRLTFGGSTSEEDLCFFDAFENSSWVECISPVLSEVQGSFNVTKICLSGEDAAMVCLMSKINECYDILNFAGLTPEQAGAINIDSLTDDQLVDITCELYGGQCNELSTCPVTVSSILNEDVPLIEAVMAVVRLCGPQCVHENKDMCPSIVEFYHLAAFNNFTQSFDSARIERTRKFVDYHCLEAADFDISCVMDRLGSSEMKPCYNKALSEFDDHLDLCQAYQSVKSCVERIVKPECGKTASDLLLQGMLVTLPETPSNSCLQDTSAGLKASASFVLFTLVTFVQFAFNSLIV